MTRTQIRQTARDLDRIAAKPDSADASDLDYIRDFYYALPAADARKVRQLTRIF